MKDKVSIVTGAASGIGKACALAYAREGAMVIVSDIQEKEGREVVSQIMDQGGKAEFIFCDISKPEQCQHLAAETVAVFGRLDYACNNAGIGGEQNPTADYTLESWARVIAINLSGVFYCMKYQIPQMLKSGGGSIVNISSILGSVGFANSPAYVAAKHGVNGLTKTAAQEYSAAGIRINAIGPAFIKTPLLKDLPKDMLDMLTTLHPIGRLGESEEVAEMVLWLSSDKSSFVTGAYFPVDGGYLSR